MIPHNVYFMYFHLYFHAYYRLGEVLVKECPTGLEPLARERKYEILRKKKHVMLLNRPSPISLTFGGCSKKGSVTLAFSENQMFISWSVIHLIFPVRNFDRVKKDSMIPCVKLLELEGIGGKNIFFSNDDFDLLFCKQIVLSSEK